MPLYYQALGASKSKLEVLRVSPDIKSDTLDLPGFSLSADVIDSADTCSNVGQSALWGVCLLNAAEVDAVATRTGYLLQRKQLNGEGVILAALVD